MERRLIKTHGTCYSGQGLIPCFKLQNENSLLWLALLCLPQIMVIKTDFWTEDLTLSRKSHWVIGSLSSGGGSSFLIYGSPFGCHRKAEKSTFELPKKPASELWLNGLYCFLIPQHWESSWIFRIGFSNLSFQALENQDGLLWRLLALESLRTCASPPPTQRNVWHPLCMCVS